MSAIDKVSPEVAARMVKISAWAVRTFGVLTIACLLVIPWLWALDVVSGKVLIVGLATGTVLLVLTLTNAMVLFDAHKRAHELPTSCTCPNVTNGLGKKVIYRDPHCPEHKRTEAAA
jgi:hypothetical protein